MSKPLSDILRALFGRPKRAAWSPPHPTENVGAESPREALRPIGINFGIDFGTSYTKVCFRDVGAEYSGVVKFGDAAIIPSLVFIEPSGRLRMGHHQASEEATPLRFLKMRLAGLTVQTDKEDILSDEIKCRAVSAWFLANVLREAQAYVHKAEAARLVGRRVDWSANLGVPVEHYDSPALDCFNKVLHIAWRWAQRESLPSDLLALCVLIDDENRNPVDEVSDFHAIPEIAAAVQSFVMSREAVPDFYIYFDIGGGTVDGVAFKYINNDGQRRVSFYSGKVAALGMAVLPTPTEREARAKEVQGLVAKVLMDAKFKDRRDWFREKAQRHHSARPGLRAYDPNDWRLICFLGGYGANDQWYQKTISATHGDFQHRNAGIPPYELVQVPHPADLNMGGLPTSEFIRFAIAYGLSIPFGEGPDIRLPSQFAVQDEIRPPQASTVDYSDHKDVYG